MPDLKLFTILTDPDQVMTTRFLGDSDRGIAMIQVLIDRNTLDIIATDRDQDEVVDIRDIPISDFDRLCQEYLQARGIQPVVVRVCGPDYDDALYGPVRELIVNLDSLNEDPPRCPICDAGLFEEPDEPRYEYFFTTVELEDESSGKWAPCQFRTRRQAGYTPGEIHACPQCGFDWEHDKDDDDKIVAAVLEWDQKVKEDEADGHPDE